MTSAKNPLLRKFKLCYLYYLFLDISSNNQFLEISWHPEGSGRFPEACPEAYASIPVSPQFRKVPEGFRKLVRKLVSILFVWLQFRKVPEGFRKLVRKLVWRHRFTAFRKLPEGFRKADRKGCRTSNDQRVCRKSDKSAVYNYRNWSITWHTLWYEHECQLSDGMLGAIHKTGQKLLEVSKLQPSLCKAHGSQAPNSPQNTKSNSRKLPEAYRKVPGSWQAIHGLGQLPIHFSFASLSFSLHAPSSKLLSVDWEEILVGNIVILLSSL